jgi:hypothetical protein
MASLPVVSGREAALARAAKPAAKKARAKVN